MSLSCCGRAVKRSLLLPRRVAARAFGSSSAVDLHRSQEVIDAVRSGRGIVALESTIVAHGMPFPKNLETAQQVEAIIRDHGACPATIAVLDGRVTAGLSDAEMLQLAEFGAIQFRKASRRDLAAAVALKESVATTVSGTAIIASDLANIPVFVTGGIGGVHRGVSDTMDVSADLTEIARTPIAIVCAGAKSILDIPRTLEMLETQGVPVLGFQTEEFPSFFSRSSGCKVTRAVDSVDDVVQMIVANQALGLRSGMIVACPIPEDHAASGDAIEAAIQQALGESTAAGIAGKQITPFMLARVNELTQGASLEANIALVKNNAAIGAQIAHRLAEVNGSGESGPTPESGFQPAAATATGYPSVSTSPARGRTKRAVYGCVVMGGAVLDLVASPPSDGPDFVAGTSNPTDSVASGVGGVGKNVALSYSLAAAGPPALLVSAIGSDVEADAITNGCAAQGLDTCGLGRVAGGSSGTYIALHGLDGALLYGVANMGVFDTLSFDAVLDQHAAELEASKIVVADGNLPVAYLAKLGAYCAERGVPLWFEPTSEAKCIRIAQAGALGSVTYCSPNMEELLKISEQVTGKALDQADLNAANSGLSGDDLMALATPHLDVLASSGVEHCLVSVGAAGVIHGGKAVAIPCLYPATLVDAEHIVNTNGAGDSFVGAAAAALAEGHPIERAINRGLFAAMLSVQSDAAVAPDLCADLVRFI